MKTRDRAYIAGIFDGEGCVYFRPRDGNPKLTITQKDKALLVWIQRLTGVGNIHASRQYHVLVISSARDIQKFIRIIYPYTRLKRKKLKRAYHHRYLWRTLRVR